MCSYLGELTFDITVTSLRISSGTAAKAVRGRMRQKMILIALNLSA